MAEEASLSVEAPSAPVSRKLVWAGRIVSALPALLLIFSGVMKLARPAQVLQEFARLGYTEDVILGIGILELICVAIYLVPRTAVLGAVLITGYLGGAVATHLVWGGLYLCDARVRALLPLRKPT
jgi:hypothetical protein